MIKNGRQYRVTRAQAEKLERALAGLSHESDGGPLLQLQARSLGSQLQDLREELADYDRLRSGTVTALAAESFDDFPHAVIKARIAAGLTQRDLAERLGLREQQIQRYEATDDASNPRAHPPRDRGAWGASPGGNPAAAWLSWEHGRGSASGGRSRRIGYT